MTTVPSGGHAATASRFFSKRSAAPELGWVWKRAKLVAKDDAPPRVDRLARIRFPTETWQAHEVMVCTDELDIPLLSKVGAAWTPRGTQEEVVAPGTNEKYYLAGALHFATDKVMLMSPAMPWRPGGRRYQSPR